MQLHLHWSMLYSYETSRNSRNDDAASAWAWQLSFLLSYSSSSSAHQIRYLVDAFIRRVNDGVHGIVSQQHSICKILKALTRRTSTAKPACSGQTAGSKSISSKIPLCEVCRGMGCSCGEGVIEWVYGAVWNLQFASQNHPPAQSVSRPESPARSYH